MMDRPPHEHWRVRVAERCPEGTDPDALFALAQEAIAEGGSDRVERMMPSSMTRQRTVWRVILDDGTIRYVVACNHTHRPVTVLTHDQVRILKAQRKLGVGRETVQFSAVMDVVQRDARQACIRKRKRGK